LVVAVGSGSWWQWQLVVAVGSGRMASEMVAMWQRGNVAVAKWQWQGVAIGSGNWWW
jgi:hypothetical protein